MDSRALELVVGVFVLLGLGALLVLALRVSNLSTNTGADGYQIEARFDNIGGLKVRSPVKMAGVTIGQVTGIKVDQNTFEAVATLKIARQYDRIPIDTTAQIFTAGLLGEQYIALEAGAEEEFLKDGGRITLTQSALVLEQLIGQFLFQKAAGDEKK